MIMMAIERRRQTVSKNIEIAVFSSIPFHSFIHSFILFKMTFTNIVGHKRCHFYFSECFPETLTDFNIFWHAASKKS